MKLLKIFSKDFYGIKLDKNTKTNQKGIDYVVYDKEYDDHALDNDEYDKKNDEIDLIEKNI
jgi:hypothetical protein